MNDDDLQRLRTENPNWSIWWAPANNAWWAVPLWHGAPLESAEAPNLGALAERMRFLERRRKE